MCKIRLFLHFMMCKMLKWGVFPEIISCELWAKENKLISTSPEIAALS